MNYIENEGGFKLNGGDPTLERMHEAFVSVHGAAHMLNNEGKLRGWSGSKDKPDNRAVFILMARYLDDPNGHAHRIVCNDMEEVLSHIMLMLKSKLMVMSICRVA